jgi:hypothetical protein
MAGNMEAKMRIKRIACVLAAVLFVSASAWAQQKPTPCTVTIASGQSASVIYALGGNKGCEPLSTAGPGVTTQTKAGTIVWVQMPAALEATTAKLIFSACSTAGCTQLADRGGSDISAYTIVGGATPTKGSYVAPAEGVAFGPWFTFTLATSAGVPVTQTAARTFTVLVNTY